ncbi:MAG: VWA domain-containing protein [Planctomycetes bacterium]|nr:VWA domain-containing protein [Planctomycetota bacterium]
MSLSDPWYLLAAIPAAALVFWVLTRTSTPLPGLRRAIGGGGLALAVAALILCAAGLFWEIGSDRRTVWVLVDRSLSVGAGGERLLPTVLQDLANSLPDDDYVGVILFDESPTLLVKPTPARELRDNYELPDWNPTDETWLAPALELASQQTLPGTAPYAIVISDGYDSAARYGGDVVRELRNTGVRVFAMPVDSQPLPETAVADFAVRLVGADERVMAIDLVVFSTIDQYVTPEIKLDGKRVTDIECDKLDAQGRMRAGVGRNPVRMLLRPERAQAVYVVEVSLAAEQNTFPRNDSLKISVRGPGESRVLLIHGENGPEAALQRALGRIGLDVTIGGAGIMPSEQVELEKYQVLILSDVPANDFTGAQLEMIEHFVRDGGGLAMIGGPRSFAPGGYYETAVERVLPVTCDVVEKGRKQTPALVIALDKSGSMGATVGNFTKMELANEGCARSIRLIPNNSFFGMLAVDTQPDWVVPLEKLKDKEVAAGRAMRNEVGGGGIYVDIAMREGVDALRASNASSKHMVLFSDGRDTNRQEGVLEFVEQVYRTENITFTTICLGEGEDEFFLQELARLGGGRYFMVKDAADLPAVFSRETALSSGNFIREEEFRPWHGLPGSLTDDVDFQDESSPPLLGYVAATAREQAHVWLWADEDNERPLLATWNIELGKALAFTSDARDRWADKWLPWESYDELWQRWIRRLLPDEETIQGVETDWDVNRTGPTLTLSFFDEDGSPRVLKEPVADIEQPDGTRQPAPVLPVGSGAYRIQFSRRGSGIYAAQVRERSDGRETLAAREQRIFVPLEELMQRPADEAALRAMAEAGGGGVITSPREILNVAPEGGFRTVWPYDELLWVAVVGLFLAIGARRFPSVWRRRVEDRRRKQEDEDRVLTARAAFERVRKTLDERNKPARTVARSDRYSAPPASSTPASPTPARPTPKATRPDDGGEGLLSAMRKVRKEMDNRREDGP